MKMVIVAVKDAASGAYGVPQFTGSRGTAVRSFGDEVNRRDERNAFFSHPEDFDLYVLGTYDDETAEFAVGPPELLARAKDHKRES